MDGCALVAAAADDADVAEPIYKKNLASFCLCLWLPFFFPIFCLSQGGGNTQSKKKKRKKNVPVAEVADLDDVPVADAAAEAEEDEI